MAQQTNTFNVFDGFSEYQVKILFQGWYTLTVWQFALSCLGFFTFTIVWHLFRWMRAFLEKEIRKAMHRMSDQFVAEETVKLMERNTNMSQSSSSSKMMGLYVAFTILSAIQIGLWLLIMMANMTFNPWVFLSIVLGYAVGDVAVHAKISRYRNE